MIVDSHAHVVAPSELYAWQGHLIANRADPAPGPPGLGDVFRDFPKLKIVISHGGGAIPYQIGPHRASFDFAPSA